MAINPYPDIVVSEDYQTFNFVSEGRTRINKRVEFQLLNPANQVYNLVLCTILPNGQLDCETASRNGDMQKILETIGKVTLSYTAMFPNRKIFLRGSDRLITRQYQLSLFSNLPEVIRFFYVEGVLIEDRQIILRETFKKGKNYDAFIFTRKKA